MGVTDCAERMFKSKIGIDELLRFAGINSYESLKSALQTIFSEKLLVIHESSSNTITVKAKLKENKEESSHLDLHLVDYSKKEITNLVFSLAESLQDIKERLNTFEGLSVPSKTAVSGQSSSKEYSGKNVKEALGSLPLRKRKAKTNVSDDDSD